jgi:hypothetical protein
MMAQGILQDHQENDNMDKELVTGIIDFIRAKKIDCSFIEETDAKNIVENLCKKFCFDLSKRYLWADVRIKEKITYNNDIEDWEVLLSTLLQNFDERVYLVVTDDEFYPWAVFDCKRDIVIDILKEQQYFEFFIFDKPMKYVLFDTHENELLLASSEIYL